MKTISCDICNMKIDKYEENEIEYFNKKTETNSKGTMDVVDSVISKVNYGQLGKYDLCVKCSMLVSSKFYSFMLNVRIYDIEALFKGINEKQNNTNDK